MLPESFSSQLHLSLYWLSSFKIIYEYIFNRSTRELHTCHSPTLTRFRLQKGGVPAAPSGTATLLRLSPSHQFYPRALLAVTHFRYPRLPWLDGRCVQGPGTYSPQYADLRLLAIPTSCRRVSAYNPN